MNLSDSEPVGLRFKRSSLCAKTCTPPMGEYRDPPRPGASLRMRDDIDGADFGKLRRWRDIRGHPRYSGVSNLKGTRNANMLALKARKGAWRWCFGEARKSSAFLVVSVLLDLEKGMYQSLTLTSTTLPPQNGVLGDDTLALFDGMVVHMNGMDVHSMCVERCWHEARLLLLRPSSLHPCHRRP